MLIYPIVLAGFSLIPVFVAFFWWRSRVRQAAYARIVSTELHDVSLNTVSQRRRWVKSLCWLIALAALIVALARPVWGVADQVVETRGIAIMLVMDVSASMDAEDVLPSRVERARLTARELIERGEGNEIGLILFAGVAFVQMPLTTDASSATLFLNAASTSSITQQGTAVADALVLAADALQSRLATEAVVILLTDGENHEGDPLLAAEQLNSLGIPVHVVGYGDPVDGTPIPIRNALGEIDTYKSDRNGNLVLTRLNEPTLEEIAEITGGSYQRAAESGIETINLLNTLDRIEDGALSRQNQPRQIERYGVFIMIAVLALLVDILLPETRLTSHNEADSQARQGVS